jgi:diguanylate cyclase (GGDEF)-like protein
MVVSRHATLQISGWPAILLGLWLCLMGAAPAHPATIEVEAGTRVLNITSLTTYWIDPQGKMTAADVAARAATLPFQPSRAFQAHTLDGGAVWQRIDLGPLPPNSRWTLQVNFNGVDHVSLHHQDRQGQWHSQLAGDHVAAADWPVRDRQPAFRLSQADTPQVYWLRIRSHPIPVSAQLLIYSDQEFDAQRNASHLLLGAYFGLALLVIYLSAMGVWQYRDVAFAAYLGYASSMMMVQVCFMGIGGEFLWPHWPAWNNVAPFVFGMLACSTGAWLVREVCGTQRVSVWLDRLLLGWAAFGILWGAVFVLRQDTLSGIVLSAYQVATMPLVLGVCFWSHRHGERWARWLALCFLPVILTAPFPTLRNMGLLPGNLLTQNSLAVGAAIEIPLMLALMARRARERNDARVRAQAMDSVDPLTGLPPLPLLVFRLRDALKRARRGDHRCALLAINFTNYHEIATVHGREVADRSLVLAAARLKTVAREVDTVARTDTHRFAILMEGPLTAAHVVAIATQTVARGLSLTSKLPENVVLRFHVASAMAPDGHLAETSDAARLVQWLNDKLSEMPHDSGRTVLQLNY